MDLAIGISFQPMNRYLTIATVCIGLTSALFAQEKKPGSRAVGPQYFPMPSTGGPPLPFSEAVKVGDTLYVSGQIGNLPGTLTLATGGIVPEARRALENKTNLPARSALGASGLALGARVEVDCIAFVPPK